MRRAQVRAFWAVVVAGGAWVASAPAFAQAPFDSPLARRPAPNVMVLIAGDRTTAIAATCSDGCHASGGGFGSGSPGDIWIRGETRIQFVRRALTGGYGVDTPVLRPDGISADAIIRTDGVMDAYKMRWGVAWFDGLGTRLAIDPTADSEAAQRAVITYNQPANDWFAYRPDHGYGPVYNHLPDLNSYDHFPFTVWDGCYQHTPYDPWIAAHAIPWNAARLARAPARIAASLEWVESYLDPNKSAQPFVATHGAEAFPMWFGPGRDPRDESIIDADPANVLTSPGAAGCRRNFVILMSDGGGQAAWNGRLPGAVASGIYNLGSGTTVDPGEQTQVFSIHFGDWTPADDVADYGWDGVAGGAGPTTAFQAVNGGVMDLNAVRSAFSSIFSMVLAGRYTGVAPTISRAGTSLCGSDRCDRAAVTDFQIFDCAGTSPTRCNSGRPSSLKWVRLDPLTGDFVGGYPTTCNYPDCYDVGQLLRAREWSDRWTLTSRWAGHANAPTESNCGPAGTCSNPNAEMISLGAHPPTTIPGLPIVPNSSWPSTLARYINFVRADPSAPFLDVPGSLQRGDTDNDLLNDPTDPYKLANIANSRPVIVGAPPGVGEYEQLWNDFLDTTISRGFGGTAPKVRTRDQVVYVGSNGGFLHAFLVGKAAATPLAGSSITYQSTGALCSNDVGPIAPGAGRTHSASLCDGREIWAYSPRLIQNNWGSLRSGHTYTVDGTPVVEDVLFTLGSTNRTIWKYRTVLVQCLGAGGPGCFALDVTNPWSPKLLWEREFLSVPGKGAATSQPVIAKVKRKVSGQTVPYYVALMGGGHNESSPLGKKGTFIAVGLEDGRVFTSVSCNPSSLSGCADFAAPPTCLDGDADGFIETCYIPSTEASVYKVRLVGGNPSASEGGGIQMEEFFRGCHSTAGDTCNLHDPDSDPTRIRAFTRISVTSDTENRMNLVFGTGDLEDPGDPNEKNYLFKIRDPDPAGPLHPWTPPRNRDLQDNVCISTSSALTARNEGSFLLSPGEKLLFNPVLAGGTVLFTTYAPSSNPCLAGNGYLYGIRHDTCQDGLDINNNGAPDTTRVGLGAQLPGEVAVNYARGTTLISNTSRDAAPSANDVTANAGKTPPPAKYRVQKLNWRRL